MNKRLSARIALALCFALLLQLAAGPIGSLIPAAGAAETNLVKKVLYSENFDDYTSASATLSATAVDGWATAGSGVTATLSNGMLNFSHTGGTYGTVYVNVPADEEKGIPASSEWVNYTIEADWHYTSSTKYYAGLAYNYQDNTSLQKAGLDFQNASSTTTIYTLNGRYNGDWVNDGGTNKQATDKADLSTVTSYRYKIETSGNNGTDAATTTFSVAPYDSNGKLGEWVQIHTATNISANTWHGTVGVFGNNTVACSVDNIEVYQMVEDTGDDDGITVLYEQNFDSYATDVALTGGSTIEGWYYDNNNTGSSASISGGKLNITKAGSAYDYIYLEGKSFSGDYVVESDITYLTGTEGAAGSSNPGTWLGLIYNASHTTSDVWSFLKGSPTTNCGYWANGMVSGSWKYDAEGTYKDYSLAHNIKMGSTYRLRITIADGTATHSYAMVTDGVAGEFTDLWTITVPSDLTSGSIGYMPSRNAGTYTVDNIKVYTVDAADDTTDPTDPDATDPTDPDPTVPEDPFEFEGEPVTIYSEDFSEYEEESVTLESGMNYDVHWSKSSASGFAVELKDGAMYLTGSNAGNYGMVYRDGATTWGNYVYEADITYLSGSGTGQNSSYIGLAFNVKENEDGTYSYFKGSINDTTAVYLNGDRNFGSDGWDYDASGVNKDFNAATGVTLGDTWRLRVTTVDNHARLERAVYDKDGKLGEWATMYEIDNIPSDMRTGAIGLFTGRGTYQFKVDNIEVYEYSKVIFNESFDYADVTITTSNAASYGLDMTYTGSSVPSIRDGKLYFTDGGAAYDLLNFTVGEQWTNYTLELDLCHTNAKGWSGVLYRSDLDSRTFHKAGLTVDNEAGTGRGLMTQNSQVNGSWYNLREYNGTTITENYTNRYLNTNVKVGDVLRFKLIIEEDKAEFWAAEYTDYANGVLGEWTLWNTVEGERFAERHMTGTFGLMNDGNGSGCEFWIDNIQVSHGTDRMSVEPPPVNVADIYLPETAITNAPVVVQQVTSALPDTNKALPAIAMMEIDESLNIIGTGKTVADFYETYRYSVIGGWVVDTEAETDALVQYLKDNNIIDVYIIGKAGTLTTSEVKAGSGVYTATCAGSELVKRAWTAYSYIRGGLLLDAQVLTTDLSNDGNVDYDDLAVLCNMAANDTGITQLIFDGEMTVDHLNYFNNHAVGAWGYAADAAGVWNGIATGYHAVVVEVPETAYDVYESVTVASLSGRPMPITHRGSHMNYGSETETVTAADGTEFVFYGETENSIEAMTASWDYFGIMGSEIDLCNTAVCSGDDATCSHTIIEGADACDHVSCELCQVNIILEHDKNLPNTTNFNAMKAQYPDIFNHGVAPQSYTLYELKMLTLTGKGNNKPSGTLKLATLEEVLEATEDFADGNYVYYCHINHRTTVDYFNKLLTEHPEYVDNCVIFEEPAEILVTQGYNTAYLTVPVPITFATDSLTLNIVQAGLSELEALEAGIKLYNPQTGSTLIYSYYDFTDGDDSFYYQIAARGVVTYHSITTGSGNLNNRHILDEGAVGCLIEQSRLVDDWHYYVDAPETASVVAGVTTLDATHTVRTLVGDKNESDNILDAECGIVQISGPALTYDYDLEGYTATKPGVAEIVYYYEGTSEGATYRVYSAPVTVTVTSVATGVSLNTDAASLQTAEKLNLFAIVEPLTAEDKSVTWTSSDETVATVDAAGVVTAVGAGTATITVTTTVGGHTDTCEITVTGISDEAKAVIEQIDALGEITVDSEEDIEAAREAYEALTSTQKEQVSNYADLIAAEKALAEALKAQIAAAEEALAEAEKAAEEAEEKAAEAEAAAKAAEEAAAEAEKKAEEAEAAAEAAKNDAAKSEEEKQAAVAEAEKARQEAEAAQAEAEKAAEEAEKAVAEKEAAVAAVEEAKAEVEEAKAAQAAAEAAAELANAKLEAMDAVNALYEELDDDLNPPKAKRLAAAEAAAEAAINAAATVEEVEAALAEARTAMEAAVAEDTAVKFIDVVEGAWYYDSVEFMASYGYMAGISDNVFGVNSQLTRAQIVTILYRMVGSPSVEGLSNPFEDIAADQWYTDAVIWAANEGVVAGISNTLYAPNRALTREQFAAMLYRWAEASAPEGDALADFADGSKVSAYAVDAMNWAVTNGLISGIADGESIWLTPQGTTTRAQAAAILARYMN